MTARLETAATLRTHLQEQVRISKQLLDRDITNRMTHLNLVKDLTSLDGQVREDRALLQRTEAALAEARNREDGIAERFTEEAQGELGDHRREFEELSQRLRKFADAKARSEIRSPVDGIVKSLAVKTIGGVVQPGDVMAEIVPVDDSLVVDARLPVEDIGFVHAGQTVQLSLTSADSQQFGTIDGEVVGVAPDARLTEKGRALLSGADPAGAGFLCRRRDPLPALSRHAADLQHPDRRADHRRLRARPAVAGIVDRHAGTLTG